MTQIITRPDELKRMMSATVEQVFQIQFRIADPPLLDYIARLLERFVRMDTLFSVRSQIGQRLVQVSHMITEAESCTGRKRAEIHQHIADFILFWTGYYPEALLILCHWNQPDATINYTAQGKRSYEIASQGVDEERAPVCWRLSEEFEICTHGINRVRRALNARSLIAN